jgi:hypothetical protein
MIPTNAAVASVRYNGMLGERQILSSEAAQSQFMRGVPYRSNQTRSNDECVFVAFAFRQNGFANGAF